MGGGTKAVYAWILREYVENANAVKISKSWTSFALISDVIFGANMTQTEFETIINDATKRIVGDIVWEEDEDHSPAREFRAEIISDSGYPIFVNGSHNKEIATLSFTLVHRGAGRIYALDLGKDHHNRTCQFVGEKHKHRWKDPFRDTEAYIPTDITALRF